MKDSIELVREGLSVMGGEFIGRSAALIFLHVYHGTDEGISEFLQYQHCNMWTFP